MSSSITEITGTEMRKGDGSALDALIDFYRAFNQHDLDGLAANWAAGEIPSMDNPIGGIRRGWPSIRDGYARLFGGPAKVNVTFHDFTSQSWNGCHLFVGREKGRCVTPTATVDLRIAPPGGLRKSTASGGRCITTARSKSRRCSPTISGPFSARRSTARRDRGDARTALPRRRPDVTAGALRQPAAT